MNKVYDVEIVNTPTIDATMSTNYNIYDYWPTTTTNSYTWTNTVTVYKYQILCPKLRCKTYNWLELNKEQECSKCGSILKAVSKSADYEIEVNE